jgi:ABC-type branched-subunit amino acid transport system permease subunit
MSDIMESLKGILKVIAVGVPALLILLGFAAAMFGWMFGYVTHDVSIRNFGIFLIIIGIVIYLIEIYLYYQSRQSDSSSYW